jgi:hypothetical protein
MERVKFRIIKPDLTEFFLEVINPRIITYDNYFKIVNKDCVNSLTYAILPYTYSICFHSSNVVNDK